MTGGEGPVEEEGLRRELGLEVSLEERQQLSVVQQVVQAVQRPHLPIGYWAATLVGGLRGLQEIYPPSGKIGHGDERSR